jgi:hypothetical protein
VCNQISVRCGCTSSSSGGSNRMVNISYAKRQFAQPVWFQKPPSSDRTRLGLAHLG